MAIKIVAFFLLLFFAPAVFSQNTVAPQGPWSLQQCIEYALKTNIQLKQTQLNAELSKVNLLQTEAGALPSVNGMMQHTYNYGRTIDQYTNTFANSTVLSQNLYVSGSLNLFNGLQRYNTIRQNQYNYLANKFDIEKNRNDISLNVAGAYLQILFNQELLAVANNQLEITIKQLDRTQKLFDAGTLAKGSLLDMQAQQATDELTLANARNQLDLAYLSLIQLLNLDSVNGFEIQKPELVLPLENLLINSPSQIFNQAVKNLPEVKSAELKLLGAERGVSAAKGAISPQLSLNATYGTGYSGLSKSVTSYGISGVDTIGYTNVFGSTTTFQPVFAPHVVPVFENNSFSKQYRDNVNQTLGFRLTVPLFNGLQTHSSISRARISKMNADLALEQTKQQLQKSIQQAYADANAGLKKYIASKKAVEANEESFKYSEQKYNVGALNVFDYNLAKTKLAKAKSDLVQAKYDFVFRSKVLDFYQGKPLTL
ncbi:MAG: TolC family protein [Bacteroidetes bacterium]|nr:TolC family protein [Bacteroidota bacterium]